MTYMKERTLASLALMSPFILALGFKAFYSVLSSMGATANDYIFILAVGTLTSFITGLVMLFDAGTKDSK